MREHCLRARCGFGLPFLGSARTNDGRNAGGAARPGSIIRPGATVESNTRSIGRRMAVAQRRESTQTSRFGVSRRENHDASAFYARFTPPALSRDSAVDPEKAIDRVFLGDARAMT